MAYLFICGLLIFLCLAGLCGLFFFEEYIRKISSLSVSYSSFLILIILLASRSGRLNDVLVVMVSILAIFSVNLLIGIGLAKNITQTQFSESTKDKT